MSQKLDSEIAVIGIDIGKNSFHLVGQDRRGALALRQKWSRRASSTPAFPDFFELEGGRSGREKMKRLIISTRQGLADID